MKIMFKLLPAPTTFCIAVWLSLLVTSTRGGLSQFERFTSWNSSCNSTHYRCVNDNCIPLSKVNNSINDCGDNTDEGVLQQCMFTERGATDPRLLPYFQCSSGKCIDLILWLNGQPNCNPGDNSDEAKLIGTSCSTSSEACCPCNETVSDSFCLSQAVPSPPVPSPITYGFDGACRCRTGFYPNQLGTNCTQRILGDSCINHYDCTGAISRTECSMFLGAVCVCAPGYYNTTVSSCIARVIDDRCVSNSDCSSVINNSTCQQSRCQCNDGLVATHDKTSCIKPYIGDLRCTSTHLCLTYFNNSRCQSLSGLCSCDPGYYTSPNRLVCVRYVLGSSCSSGSISDHCSIAVGNSTCLGGHCNCLTGYRGDYGTTFCTPKKYGDSCSLIDDCKLMGNSTCSDGICQCRDVGFQLSADGTRCTSRGLNDSCSSDDQCSKSVPHSRCQRPAGQCRCAVGYQMAADGGSCDRKLVDDTCENEAECSTVIENAECRGGRCVCRVNYRVVSEDRSRCRLIPINELPCVSNTQCSARMEHAVCGPQGICECGCGTIFNGDGESTCQQIQVSSLTCQSDDRCVALLAKSTCVAGRCSCRHGYYETLDRTACVDVGLNSTTCLPPPSVDRICRQAIQFSECSPGGVCQCIAGYQLVGTRRCVPSILDQRCLTDIDCTHLVRHTQCLLPVGHCACVDGYNTTDGVTCSYVSDSLCSLPVCQTFCGALIGLFVGSLIASVLTFLILYRKKLKRRKPRKVLPMPGTFGVDRAWHLDWNNRPPAHVPVMYKSPSLMAPDELYGDLLQLNLHDVLNTMMPGGHNKRSLTTVSQA